ncbi:exodeoxyribonuclease VII large subunit [Amylibacter kogurei]|uniref:Exodeoxyribonuclease 7 large subunit n=1 Tax=Paramylibacter kogurei TaxID=1889778 RepID=A0A2G5K646_9RHOB|nr:exodeoxyribonuclease VII large subunit [Amylibacter kogurei]PIB24492.1 exodeoxyribonuclease VII large subunit [Amylibacter kogurei]
MSDLIDAPSEGQNAPEFSVSEISGAVKRMIEGEFSHVRIRAEVGRVSRPRSGHVYLDLKDDRAVLAGVMWKGVVAKLRTQPEEGMEVVATGKLTTFPGQSKYQMVIENIAPAGVGALMAMLEKRKQMLAGEGIFDQDRKQPIPYLPEVIGVVTSPSGAVIRDILHRLRDRFPRKVLIWPVAVQGEKCAPEVTAAIEGFNAMSVGGAIPRPDLIIVARGGGSLEDLWGFNEESVVRAAAASDIPLISAVGHETDTTLIDFASDLRAPTPTAAAEHAVPVRADLLGWLGNIETRRLRSLQSGLDNRRQRLRDLSRALPNPAELVGIQGQRLDVLAGRLPRALQSVAQNKRTRLSQTSAGLRPQILNQQIVLKKQSIDAVSRRFAQGAKTQVSQIRSRLDGLDRLRETLGYTATLKRGYAVVRDDAGALVSNAKTAGAAAGLDIQFADGHVQLGAANNHKPKPKKNPPPKPSGGQGSLF